MGMTEIDKKALKRGGGPVCLGCAPDQTEPLAIVLKEATRLSGLSRSHLYELQAGGQITFIKCRSRVLVDYRSLKSFLAGLPRVAA